MKAINENRLEKLWKYICMYEGEKFLTPTQKIPYTYVVKNNYILINNDSRRRITKKHLEKALVIPNPSPSKLTQEKIWGPSYVCGILTDKRIINQNI